MDGGMVFALTVIALCSYLSVKAWARARQKEREAFYRAEAVKKIAEMQGNIPESVLSLLQAGIQPKSSVPAIMQALFPPLRFDSEWARSCSPGYQRSQIVKTLSDMPDGAAAVTEFLRQENVREARRAVEFAKFGGLTTLGGGIGLLVFLRFYNQAEPVYLVGLIPMLVGAGLLLYAFRVASVPKAE
jgi:hypothetical protein